MNYLHYNVLLLTISGLYKIETESTIKRLLFKFWRVTVNLAILFLTVSSLIDLWTKEHNDFKLVVRNYVYLSGGFCFWLRMTYLVVYDDTSYEIVKEMQGIFKYKTSTGVGEKDLGKYINLTNKFTFVFLSYGTFVAHCYVLLPMMTSTERTLSLPIWYPFEWKSSPYYEVAVFLQMFIQQALATTVVGTDTFFASGLILLAAQFRILGWEVKHVLHKTLLRNGVELDSVLKHTSESSEIQESPLGDFGDSPEFKTELMNNLVEVIEFYRSLLYLCARFDNFFSPVYLMYFVILVATSVFTEYNLTLARDLAAITQFTIYIIALALTLFIPCCLGNFLTSQAEEFLYDIYDSPWYLCDHNFQTSLKMLHHSSSRPTQFTIGKFGVLSLNTFVGIVKASVSYLAVLRQVTSEN